jgi:hypothetical protein
MWSSVSDKKLMGMILLYLREELYAFLLYVKPPGERRCLPLFDEHKLVAYGARPVKKQTHHERGFADPLVAYYDEPLAAVLTAPGVYAYIVRHGAKCFSVDQPQKIENRLGYLGSAMDGRTVYNDFEQAFAPINVDYVLGGDGEHLLRVVGYERKSFRETFVFGPDRKRCV